MASWSFAFAAESSPSLTGMGTAVDRSTAASTRSEKRAHSSSATSDPMLWPTTDAVSTPAASMTFDTHSAMSPIDARGGPSDRPCPGRSTASTSCPWCAKYRV